MKLYQKTEEENEFTEVKAKEEQGILSTTNTFEIETKDSTCPNNVTNIKTVIADDYIIISFDPAIDNATLYEYYIETEEKLMTLMQIMKKACKSTNPILLKYIVTLV